MRTEDSIQIQNPESSHMEKYKATSEAVRSGLEFETFSQEGVTVGQERRPQGRTRRGVGSRGGPDGGLNEL